jgi:hypothetical protein
MIPSDILLNVNVSAAFGQTTCCYTYQLFWVLPWRCRFDPKVLDQALGFLYFALYRVGNESDFSGFGGSLQLSHSGMGSAPRELDGCKT